MDHKCFKKTGYEFNPTIEDAATDKNVKPIVEKQNTYTFADMLSHSASPPLDGELAKAPLRVLESRKREPKKTKEQLWGRSSGEKKHSA